MLALVWRLLVALGILLVLALRERRMPWAREITAALALERGEVEAAVLMGRVERRHAKLFRSRPRLRDPRLQWHVDHQLLPVVALYRTVEHEEGHAEAMRAVDAAMDAISRTSLFGPALGLIERMGDPFDVMRRVMVLGSPMLLPSSGWSMRVTRNDAQGLSFVVDRCFYADVLGALGAPEILPSFCGLDDRRYGSLRSVAFSRTRTIARGSSSCDFHLVPREAAALS